MKYTKNKGELTFLNDLFKPFVTKKVIVETTNANRIQTMMKSTSNTNLQESLNLTQSFKFILNNLYFDGKRKESVLELPVILDRVESFSKNHINHNFNISYRTLT